MPRHTASRPSLARTQADPRQHSVWLALLGGAVGAALLAGAAWADPAGQPAADPQLIAHGKYLVTAGDCVACHSAPGGAKFAGGLYMDTPFGKISTPNLTPDQKTGIGSWTDAQFYRAMHEGIDNKGNYLYPVFPFPWFTNVSKDDVAAIKAYLFSLKPVDAPRKPLQFAFPFNVRTSLLGWRVAFFHHGPYQPDASKSPEWNRGAYLVTGLEHCGECHNGNSLFGNTRAAGMLKGGEIDHWWAPNLTSNVAEGLGAWSQSDIEQYLKTGAAPGHGVVLGPMAQTVHDSLSKLTDSDIRDIALYLKSVPAKSNYQQVSVSDEHAAQPAGAQVYLSWCASCHQQKGEGIANKVPPLAGNGAVAAGGPENVIRAILGGLEAKDGYAPMPAFGTGMTDQQIADVTNYVRQSWGNKSPATAGPGQVATIRGMTKTVLAANYPNLPGGCPPIANPKLAAVMGDGSKVQGLVAGITQTNMLDQVDGIVRDVRAAAPGAKTDDVVNALTLAYCPVVGHTPGLGQAEKSSMLGRFSVLVYSQLGDHGKL